MELFGPDFFAALPLIKNQLARADVQEKIKSLEISYGKETDPWGMDLETVINGYAASLYLYEEYFRTEVRGVESIPEKRCMIISNHSGQIPLDGGLIFCSMIKELGTPRIARGMVERLSAKLPYVSTLFARSGMVIGDPKNCEKLLEKENLVMIFPEGVRGTGKTYDKAYQLQRFGLGFMRLALKTKTPIVTASVVGAEETYPSFWDGKPLAKPFGLPYIPFTPFFPLMGPLGLLPLPAKIRIYYSEKMEFDADPNAPDEEIQKMVDEVKEEISRNLARGLVERKTVIGG